MTKRLIKKHEDIHGSEFEDLNLSGSKFSNINLSKSTFQNINFSNVSISAANFSHVKFLHIGPAPDETGQHPKQGPVSFREGDFNGSTFEKVDLSNVKILDCNIDGMKINGISVSDMIHAYNEKPK